MEINRPHPTAIEEVNNEVDSNVNEDSQELTRSRQESRSSETRMNNAAFAEANQPDQSVISKKRDRELYESEDKLPLYKIIFEEVDEDGQAKQSKYKSYAEAYYKHKDDVKTRGEMVNDKMEIEFIQATRAEQERRLRVEVQKMAKESEEEESLFVGQEESERSEEDVVKSPDSGPKSKKRKSKSHIDSIKNMVENANLLAEREQRIQMKRAKQRQNGEPKKESRKQKRSKTVFQSNLGSLVREANIFGDELETREEGQDENEEFSAVKSKNKKDALREIIASLDEKEKELAQMDINAVEGASAEFRGHALIKMTPQGWWVKGMKTHLKHFQMVGAAWMIKRENHNKTSEARAGLLADEMGLGKTIMTLSMIMNDIAASQINFKAKRTNTLKTGPTLIVCPASLVTNWEDEIKSHCDQEILQANGIARRWSPKNAQDSFMTVKMLQECSIVITTPGAIQRSCRKIVFPPYLQSMEEKEAYLEQTRDQFRGDIFKVEWHRIVIDEATIIKNHLSNTTLAIRELIAKSRFALSGTPLMNTAKTELYSYFKFLRVPNTGDFRTFSHNYDLDKREGKSRMSQMLQKYMLRRTYKDKVMGQQLVTLPKAAKIDMPGNMDDIERHIYEIVENRMMQQIEDLNERGTLKSSHILTRILRLRQCASHLLLVLDIVREVLNAEDIAILAKLAQIASSAQAEVKRNNSLRHLREILRAYQNGEISQDGSVFNQGTINSPINVDTQEDLEGLAFSASMHGLSCSFWRYIDELQKQRDYVTLEARQYCPCCSVALKTDEAYLASCNHLFHPECLESLHENTAILGSEASKCPSCGITFHFSEKLAPRKDMPQQTNESKPQKKDSRAEAKKLMYLQNADPLPSAKTKVIMQVISNWIKEDTEDNAKRASGDQPHHTKAQIHYVLFTGAMSIEDRKHAVEGFRSYPGPCVFLSSLRCGGMGLNLTMSNRVINTDPWWNEALENQAFGRAYRIGQQKKTTFVRIFLNGTIDQRILKMQKEKARLIDGLMTNKENLTLDELLELFGNTSKDPSKVFVLGEDRPESQTILEDDAYLQWGADHSGTKL